jgi:aspartyl-tRNA(Asn)/glutamyl-tRNA(Gln) amidotransferase subunit B
MSVRPRGDTKLYKRVEVKNLNSYAAVRGAVTYEFARQVAVVEAGHAVLQETRLWDEEGTVKYDELVPEASVRAQLLPEFRGRTARMRSKENAHDYRYFPEPDLPPFEITAARLERLRAGLPELPGAKARRLLALGVSEESARVFVENRPLSDYFLRTVALGVPAPEAANYVRNQIGALLNERGLDATKCPIPPEYLVELHEIAKGAKDIALKKVWPKVAEEGLPPKEILKKYDLAPMTDDGAVRKACEDVWGQSAKIVADLLHGKDKARGGLVGAVMKATQGKAPPELVNKIFDDLLAKEKARAGPVA